MESNLKVKITTPSLILFIKILKVMGVNISVIAKKLNEISLMTHLTKLDVDELPDELKDGAIALKKEVGDVGERQEQFGVFLAELLFDGVDKAEGLTYKFLSKIFCMDEEEVQELDFFLEILPALKSYPGWSNFLDNAVNLEKSKK